MKVVIDSNVLLVAVGKSSRFRPIWQAFMNGDYQIVISEEIIHEYEEILKEHSAPGVAALVMEILSVSPDVIYKRIYYAWNMIKSDADDNKFFDAAVAGNVDFLVTNDTHFNELLNINFPRINLISADYFLTVLHDLKR
ncbi:MAG TPA: putative toxin-antitoxin system toxin component, PIN family [Agriterribacter sp.]|nr:putative toxin-antitoxin system toxin component, PIN family [Agriterribacter sp.]